MAANLGRINVAIVDDDRRLVQVLRVMLRAFGVRNILVSHDPVSALQPAQEWPLDVIFAAHDMARLGGPAFARRVRTASNSRNPFLPIVLLTAHTDTARLRAAFDAGVTEICAKPVDASSLWATLAEVINNPRPFVRTRTYFGPDRRRRNPSEFHGVERRRSAAPIRAAS